MNSNVKLILLWVLATIPMVLIGWFIGITYDLGMYGPTIMLELMILLIIFLYFSSDSVILRRYQAKRIRGKGGIFEIIQEMAEKVEIKAPKIYVAETLMPVIFSIGRNPKHASIVITDSLINLLDDDEMESVIAHEMYHIKSGDILIGTIAAAITGPLTSIINSTSVFSGFFIATFVAPPAALIIRMAVPRSREHFADLKSVDVSGKPLKLISALSKIQERLNSHNYRVNPSHAHLFILNPLRDNALKLFGIDLPSYNKLFDTHPPINERLNILGITQVSHREIEIE